ncbi:MFS transporter [Rugosimonospora africana]|uniref:MFS transporter n=1 Tax=Rugosimonospora africana TaxID=556532 RepID=A0A8J3QQ89_9ACTN|nr:MFS transporter [Rugosimonospora africana]GIH14521.1 MFS transporter [Rugosimonospora africana]
MSPLSPARRHPRWTLAIVCVATFMLLLDVTVVAVALGDIQTDFGSDLSSLQWVVDAYTLPLAGLLLTAATLGDRIGRRRIFLAGMALFTLGSLACALAWSPLILDLTRAAQGVGGALLFGVGLPLVGAAFPEPRARAAAIGVFGATLAGATAVGPLVGGALVDGPGWRWIFLVNVPIGLAALVAGWLRLEESRVAAARAADWPGTALLTAGLLALLLGLIRGNADGWLSAEILGLFAAAAVLLVGFVIREASAREPMLDLRLFRNASFAGVSIGAWAVSATLVAATSYLGLYLVNTLNYSPFQAGLRFLPLTVASFVAAPIVARLVDRVPPRVTVGGGLALSALGLWLAGQLHGDSRWTALLAGFIVAGVGLGMANASMSQAALAAVDHTRAGMATGTVNTMRQIGVAAGVAVLGAVFQHRATADMARQLAAARVPHGQASAIADAVGSGAGLRVADSAPAALRPALAAAARVATVNGLNEILIGGAIAAGIAALIALVVVRPAPAPATTTATVTTTAAEPSSTPAGADERVPARTGS